MIWPGVYRHTTSDSLHAVEACEPVALGGTAPPARFLKMGRLLLREDYLNGEYSRELQERTEAIIAFATGRRREFWAYTRIFAQVRVVRSRAQAILLKNNIRAFYVPESLSLKVSNPNEAASAARILNEVNARRRIHPTTSFVIPEIAATGDAEGKSFILEALLERFRTMTSLEPAFAKKLVEFQRANAVASRASQDMGTLHTKLLDAMRQLGLGMPPWLERYLAQLKERQVAAEPWTLCNGDLSRSNIFLREGTYAVTDWEFAKDGPASLDAVRLSTQFPRFADAYISAHGHPEARVWLCVACLHSILDHVSRYKGLSDNRHGRAVHRKTAQKARELLALAEALGGQRAG